MPQIIPIYHMLIFWSFGFGILHTLMPCEDKTIFAFYTFGVSKNSRQAFTILTMYGLGLLSANMTLGSIISIFGDILFGNFDQLILNGFAAWSIIISGSYLLYQAFHRTYIPHAHQEQEFREQFHKQEGRFRKRTAYLLGILSGIPPCLFELTIYSQAALASGIYGMVIVLFFALGTWVGLYALGMVGIGTIMAVSRSVLRHDLLAKGNERRSIFIRSRKVSKIEVITALVVIALGVILLVFVMLGIDIYNWVVLPNPP